jgi:hypothetical protein
MAETVVAITLTPGQLARIDALVAGGEADSVPDFVARSVQRAIEHRPIGAGSIGPGVPDRRAPGQPQLALQTADTLDDALAATGGELTTEEREWADEVLRTMTERVRGFVGSESR